jgi:acyl transferase domain-containing protein/3-hydroxymyristoyl/3-hydroxydecanoyl-(acyl carrier protein) dehydratase
MQPDEAIAIVGIGGLFAGAETLDQFWANIRDGVDSTSEVAPSRWLIEPESAFDPRPAVADRVYSIRGGFVAPPQLDWEQLDLEPSRAKRLDPVFHFALHVACQAWTDARTDQVDRGRVGVIFGNIVLPTETASELSQEIVGRAFEERLGLAARSSAPIEPLNAFPAGLPASVVARALNLGGPAYTVDAACASSLYALKLASDALRTGRTDAMLCGGVSRPDPLYTQMGFSQLRALSMRGKAAPLDQDADGLVVGEGAGMFLLKRLVDAVNHGDRIYGIVAGIGLSNDVHGDLLAPSSDGQLRAMRMAYERAGWSPTDVDLVECHAAGTPTGDAVEAESIRSLWGASGWTMQQCVIGSVKSNIGHALTAAGAAGLLKVLLALKQRTLPPTANFERPGDRLQLDESPFRVLTHAEPWARRRAHEPRRAAVSGFGFGGINCHVLIEEWDQSFGRGQPERENRQRFRPASDLGADPTAPIAIVGLSANFGPFAGKEPFADRVFGYDRDLKPTGLRNCWEITEAPWFQQSVTTASAFLGYYIDSLELAVDQFRIPPKELGEMLPQQSLLLRVAAEAVGDARWDTQKAIRTGVLIGIGLDLSTTNFHLRWSLAEKAREWNDTLGLGLAPDELARWVEKLRVAAGPALTANRTMGSLGGLIASRVAREFKIGGPSFTVSCDETSGIQALTIACRWLQERELDAAVVGAVDFAGDIRMLIARNQLQGGSGTTSSVTQPEQTTRDETTSCACDGAVAFVLKRLDDAQHDGDHVYAILGEIVTGDVPSHTESRSRIERDEDCAEIESIEVDLGHAGAATGLASVAKAALCLDRQIFPADGAADGPRFWLRNRAEGVRRARVSVSGLGGMRWPCKLPERGGSTRLDVRSGSDGASPARNYDAQIMGRVDLEGFEAAPVATRAEFASGRNRSALFAIEADSATALAERIDELSEMVRKSPTRDVGALARQWWRLHPNDHRLNLGKAIIADSVDALHRHLELAQREDQARDRRVTGRLALIYPGLGNHFAGMGRALSAMWPDILRAQDAENRFLREQLDPRIWWHDELPRKFADHRAPILGSVSVGALVTDVLCGLGVMVDAAIGYSLGESAALVSLRAWRDRDEMLRRLQASPLFQTELAGPCDAARRLWGIPHAEPVDWVAAIVPRRAEDVREAAGVRSRVYPLIKNTDDETVIGGQRRAVGELVKALACPLIELPAVSTVHCEIGRSVEAEYRALHDLETTAPAGVEFYSGAWGRPYSVDRRTAADAVTAQASQMIDYPAVIERAYADGIRFFMEVGPGASCTRLIDRILAQRPHVACSACRPDREPMIAILDVLAQLIDHRMPVNLADLYGRHSSDGAELDRTSALAETPRRPTIRVDVRAKSFAIPAMPRPRANSLAAAATSVEAQMTNTSAATAHHDGGDSRVFQSSLLATFHETQRASADAHAAFLRVAQGANDLIGKHLGFQLELIDGSRRAAATDQLPARMANALLVQDDEKRSVSSQILMDRSRCLEFAVGSIGAVLGPDFAAVDRFPTRVRLPDEPLMLVDRILLIEGQSRSLQSGRVVTEHVIEPGAWYLDAGRIAPSIAIEAGQADLFLCAYLGVDFETSGLAMYRLLDATVTFHRQLPAAGEVINYDIRISHFFRQGDTILFRFQFDATVAGEPLLTMRDGCAGFFTPEELAAGKGIVPRGLDGKSKARPVTSDGSVFVAQSSTRLDARGVDSLRRGNLAAAFGSSFDCIAAHDTLGLPGGRMSLIHRVADLDPTGGHAGLGFVRAEADIQPGDWFMVCHFVDDRVMPGTLMYECCLHTLRIFMKAIGWVGSRDRVAYEPVVGVANRLKCRGQIVESTRAVTYEVTIKERGYRPEPYVIADALILADGKPIVEVIDMALQLSGTNREELERIWAAETSAVTGSPAQNAAPRDIAAAEATVAPVFDHDRILAFATGKPSDAFGEPYSVFDRGRFVARLPGPPYQFLDRITRIDAQPFVLAVGGSAEAQFDIDPDAWYFAADRQNRLPFAVLLEAALQACGWMAAYMGSALASEADLKFRNLGGTACQHRPVPRDAGTLTTRFKVTNIARTAGMILQQYDFAVHGREGLVYDGSTEFGFFQPSALVLQVGIRDAVTFKLSATERNSNQSFMIPDAAPFPDERWRMIDEVDELLVDGGPHGLGFARASKRVDADAWFFGAHFLDDPVWPGSLGLESLLQLLKVFASRRWGAGLQTVFESPAIGRRHRWTYRGQIVPTNERVTVEAEIKECDDQSRVLVADGHLSVDGKVIYRMNEFSLCLRSH